LREALYGESRKGDVLNREQVERGRGVVEGTLQRQQCARRTRRLVVSVMEIDPALFGVRDRARFIARERQRRADDSQLADHDQENREQAPTPLGSSTQQVTALHFCT